MRILAVVGALAIIAGISAAVFFFGGFYSVAGTAEDPALVRWALIQVRTASIDRHDARVEDQKRQAVAGSDQDGDHQIRVPQRHLSGFRRVRHRYHRNWPRAAVQLTRQRYPRCQPNQNAQAFDSHQARH